MRNASKPRHSRAVELGEARSKLAAAQKAVERGTTWSSRRNSPMKRAQPPTSRPPGPEPLRPRPSTQDIKKGTATLVEEMQRKTGENDELH